MQYIDPPESGVFGRLIPCNPDEAFHTFCERWTERPDGTRRPVIGNSRNNELPVPDLVYYLAAEYDDPKLLARTMHAITFVVLDWYHNVPRAGKPGKDGKARFYDEFVRCAGKDRHGRSRCSICASEEQQRLAGKEVKPRVFGQAKYLKLSNQQRDQLLDELDSLKKRCASCGVGEVATFRYDCPECKSVLLNRYDTPDVSDEDLDLLENGSLECPDCHKEIRAEKVLECTRHIGEAYKPGCSNPTKLPPETGLFDVDIMLACTKYEFHILEFSPQRQFEHLPANLNEPLPLYDFLSYMTLKEQAEAMGIVNPFGEDEERELEAYFAKNAPSRTATPSSAGAEEADPDSIPWGSKTKK